MTVTVAAVHTAPVSLEARRDLVVTGGRGTHARSDFLMVRVVTSDGVEGYGEVSATPWPHDVIGSHYYADEVLESPIDNNGLRARLPEGVGLGVLPTAEVLRRFS